MLKIRWVRGLKLHQFARTRVPKTQSNGVQPLAFQTELVGKHGIGSIHQIAYAGMSNRRHVNPDLMRTAGFELDLKETRGDERLQS
jgi:hypothetical protein